MWLISVLFVCLVCCVGSQHGQLTPRIRVLLEKLTVSHVVKKFSKDSSPYSQEIATCPCYKHINSFYVLYPINLRSVLISSSFPHPSLPNSLFPSVFPIKTMYVFAFSPTRATYRAHFILLDQITPRTTGEGH